jgi:hypothetical protein
MSFLLIHQEMTFAQYGKKSDSENRSEKHRSQGKNECRVSSTGQGIRGIMRATKLRLTRTRGAARGGAERSEWQRRSRGGNAGA